MFKNKVIIKRPTVTDHTKDWERISSCFNWCFENAGKVNESWYWTGRAVSSETIFYEFSFRDECIAILFKFFTLE